MFQPLNKSPERSGILIQPHLEIGEENDEHEKEANNVADKVMRMSDGTGDEEEEKKMTDGTEGKLQRMHDGEDEEKKKMTDGSEGQLQMMTDTPFPIRKMTDGTGYGMKASKNVEQGIHNTKGNGESLSPELQNDLGEKMGADFSGVKIHTDENAAQLNKEVGAKAFTHGNDIYFNKGQYNPSSQTGKHLLAHELTHTVQQGGGKSYSKIQRTAVATKKGDEILLTAHIYFYGTQAESIAGTAPQQIQDYWNEPKGKVKINGKKYLVKFQVTGEYVPGDYEGDKDLSNIKALSAGNKGNAKNNFIRVEKLSNYTKDKVSHMHSNQGFFTTENSGKTAYAHEFGHGLGLDHNMDKPGSKQTPVTDKSPGGRYTGTSDDYRGMGQPGIMVNKGALVDKKYRKNKKSKIDSETYIDPDKPDLGTKVEITDTGVLMDEDKRKVVQYDIDLLHLDKLLGDKDVADVPEGRDYKWGFKEGDSEKVSTEDSAYYTQGDSFQSKDVKKTTVDYLRKKNNFKDAQYVKVIYLVNDFMATQTKASKRLTDPGDPNEANFVHKSAVEHELINNANVPGMEKNYEEGKVRYEYVDASPGFAPVVLDLVPAKHENGIPEKDTVWLKASPIIEDYK